MYVPSSNTGWKNVKEKPQKQTGSGLVHSVLLFKLKVLLAMVNTTRKVLWQLWNEYGKASYMYVRSHAIIHEMGYRR